MRRVPPPVRKIIVHAVAAALALPSLALADTIVVDGTVCTLAYAIASANTDAIVGGCAPGNGRDTIQIPATQYIIGQLPTVTSDMDLVGIGATNVILSGDNAHRFLMIGDESHAPDVTITNLLFAGGKAQGGNATNGGGAGAGLGGVIFVYEGSVSIDHSYFSENGADGGASTGGVGLHTGGGGGGGLFGGGGAGTTSAQYQGGNATGGGEFGGGGGGGGNTYYSEGGGGSGGNGSGPSAGAGGIAYPSPGILPNPGGLAGGGGGGGAPGQSVASQAGAGGGFGGGGGGGAGSGLAPPNVDTPGAGGNGGFGGGGGAGGSSSGSSPGGAGSLGGFGGGGGVAGSGSVSGPFGYGGFGGGDTEGGGGGGAGFGGVLFVRSGHVNLTNTTFSFNGVVRGAGGAFNSLGKGGAIFVLSSLSNTNGNDQGMPTALPLVTGCAVSFSNNHATDAGTSSRDNADVYGVDSVVLGLACGDSIFADGFGTQ